MKDGFLAPWNNTTNANASTFSRQLDCCQADCAELGVVVSDDDKVTHFISKMYVCSLFGMKIMD